MVIDLIENDNEHRADTADEKSRSEKKSEERCGVFKVQ